MRHLGRSGFRVAESSLSISKTERTEKAKKESCF